MPFLRLTRDRRGFENTYLMHADRPGDRPRILYWYRTAPGIVLGRPPLDEDAIRAIEDNHPHIEFDWPAILALSEVMTPEDEAPAPKPQRDRKRSPSGRKDRDAPRRDDRGEPRRGSSAPGDGESEDEAARSSDEKQGPDQNVEAAAAPAFGTEPPEPAEAEPSESSPSSTLVDELAGREIAARLRARHAEIVARIESLDIGGAERDALFRRAEAIDPELWMTPESVLEGVRNADALFEQLRDAVGHSSRE